MGQFDKLIVELSDIYESRGIKRVVYFHCDHWEPWNGVFGGPPCERNADDLVRFIDTLNKIEFARKLTLFYKVFTRHMVNVPETPRSAIRVHPDDKIAFPRRSEKEVDICRDAIRYAVANSSHEFQVHIHHENYTYNHRLRFPPAVEYFNSPESRVHEDERFSLSVKICLDNIRLETGLPLDRWFFVHGLWALNASDPKVCHIVREIEILRKHGCLGDFTFPAGRSQVNPRLEVPYFANVVNKPKGYDLQECEPEFAYGNRAAADAGKFFVWASDIKHGGCSIDYFASAYRKRLDEMNELARETLNRSFAVNGTLYIKTHGHSLHPQYFYDSQLPIFPHMHPGVQNLFCILFDAAAKSGAAVDFLGAAEVYDEFVNAEYKRADGNSLTIPGEPIDLSSIVPPPLPEVELVIRERAPLGPLDSNKEGIATESDAYQHACALLTIGTCRIKNALAHLPPSLRKATNEIHGYFHYPKEMLQLFRFLTGELELGKEYLPLIFTDLAEGFFKDEHEFDCWRADSLQALRDADTIFLEISSLKQIPLSTPQGTIYANINAYERSLVHGKNKGFISANEQLRQYGGRRPVASPQDEFMDALNELLPYLEKKRVIITPHFLFRIPGTERYFDNRLDLRLWLHEFCVAHQFEFFDQHILVELFGENRVLLDSNHYNEVGEKLMAQCLSHLIENPNQTPQTISAVLYAANDKLLRNEDPWWDRLQPIAANAASQSEEPLMLSSRQNTNPIHEERNALVETALEWGYFGGGVKNRKDLWIDKSILDIGMGAGPHSISFVEGGCKHYVGVDPLVGTDHVRDFRTNRDPSVPAYHAFPFTPKDIMRIYPNIQLYSGYLEEVADEIRGFNIDVALMAAVTEHLQNPHEVFKSIWNVIEPDGIVWFSHCNYYSWTGHHQAPRSVLRWDHNNPKHNAVADWKHLEPDSPWYNNPNFNRIRLQDLRDLVEKYFEIIEWIVSVEGLSRLTPELREKYRKYSLDELLGQNIYVTARRREVPLATDLSDRQFFHPDESYLGQCDFINEDISLYQFVGMYFFTPDGFLGSHSNNNSAGARVINLLGPGDKVTMRKFNAVATFTVAEIIRPKDSNPKARLVEPVPGSIIDSNRDQWTMIWVHSHSAASAS